MRADLVPIKELITLLEQAEKVAARLSLEEALAFWNALSDQARERWFFVTKDYLAEIEAETMREASARPTSRHVDDPADR